MKALKAGFAGGGALTALEAERIFSFASLQTADVMRLFGSKMSRCIRGNFLSSYSQMTRPVWPSVIFVSR